MVPSQPQDPAEAGDRLPLHHIQAGGVGDIHNIQTVAGDTQQLPLWIHERAVTFPTETKITRDHSRALDLDTVPAPLYAATDLIQEEKE